MGITERRVRDKEQMRRNILDAAMDLFLTEGYANVSLRKIAEKIEYSPATIYLYFKDKDEIFFRLHEEVFAKFLNVMKQAQRTADPLERLHEYSELYLEFALENPEYYDLMFIMKAPMRTAESERGTGYESFDLLRQTVAECIEQGKIKAENVWPVAIYLWSGVHGLASLIIRDRLKMVPKAQLQNLVRDVLQFKTQIFTDSQT